MPAPFTVIVSIASVTRKHVKDNRAQAVRHFNFEIEKVENTCSWFNNNTNFTKGKVIFYLIVFFECVLKSSDNLPRNGKTITKSFFSGVNVTGFLVTLY